MATSYAQVKAAIKASKGNLTAASRLLGLSRGAVWARVQKSPKLKELVDSFDDKLLDTAIRNVQAAAERGEQWATRLILQYRGHKRGWVPRSELTGADGQPVGSTKTALSVEEMKRLHASPEAKAMVEKLHKIAKDGECSD